MWLGGWSQRSMSSKPITVPQRSMQRILALKMLNQLWLHFCLLLNSPWVCCLIYAIDSINLHQISLLEHLVLFLLLSLCFNDQVVFHLAHHFLGLKHPLKTRFWLHLAAWDSIPPPYGGDESCKVCDLYFSISFLKLIKKKKERIPKHSLKLQNIH